MKEMIEAEIWTIARTDQGNAVLLRPLGSDITVPIFVGQLEIQSILIGFKDLTVSRPLTHDLFLALLRQTGLTLDRAEVHDLKDNTFHARLIITGEKFPEDLPLVLDARPSDAFALAVRRKCPIMISRAVVEQAGVPADLMLDEMNNAAAIEYPGHRDLRDELNRALAAEEYERAAEIRDAMILLHNEQENRGAP
ncbi:MAG: bifunctional nuclease family protein [Treponema sp.]|jgi:bifunctional DNase/RNase|nr:bifunctional nuclease family protein [Treponema sp.]